jgi:hypothetical protein
MYNQLALDGDHSNMVKFGDHSSQGYQNLRNRILEIVKQGPTIVEPRYLQQQNGTQKSWLVYYPCVDFISVPHIAISAVLRSRPKKIARRTTMNDYGKHSN